MRPLHFSLRSLSLALLLASLSGCALLIPENPSAPRYNSVLGPPRAPALNNSTGAPAPSSRMNAPSPSPSIMAAPAQEVTVRDMPAPAPQVVAAPAAEPVRQVPMENAPVTVAQNDYPDLRRVPANPPAGEDERMNRIRAQLEADRAATNADKNRLLNDAAAEPSLLAPDPVTVTPLPAPMPPQSAIPAALPVAFAPPAPLGATPRIEPITLRPPTVASAAPGTGMPAHTPPAAVMAPAVAGGLNPMEGAAPIVLRAPTSYANTGQYLPPSRYNTRRD